MIEIVFYNFEIDEGSLRSIQMGLIIILIAFLGYTEDQFTAFNISAPEIVRVYEGAILITRETGIYGRVRVIRHFLRIAVTHIPAGC